MSDKQIKVNKVLGVEPRLGILNRAQIVSSLFIVGFVYLIVGFLQLGMSVFLIASGSLVLGWLILVGESPHEFMDLFLNPPGDDWCNGDLLYHPEKKRIPPTITQSQSGKKLVFVPFQNYLHMNGIFTIKKGKQKASGYFLKNGKKCRVIWGIKSSGFHDLHSDENAASIAKAISSGIKEIPPGENLRICWSKFAEQTERIQQLEDLISNVDSSSIAILLKNELGNIKKLTKRGIRQKISKTIFCTWTTAEDVNITRGDPLGNFLLIGALWAKKFINWVTGNKKLLDRKKTADLLDLAFNKSYHEWMTILSNRIGWQVSSMDAKECFDFIYRKFNDCGYDRPTLAQEWTLNVDGVEIEYTELITRPEDLTTVLIEGKNGIDSTPQHKGRTDTVYLPGRGQLVGVLTLKEKPSGWSDVSEQIQWLWSILRDEKVRDTEAIVEISSANQFWVRHSLSQLAKVSHTKRKKSLEKGRGGSAEGIVDGSSSLEASTKIYTGDVAICTATAFLIYRKNHFELTRDCLDLARSFRQGKLIREDKIAWKIWLELLPITINNLLQKSSTLADRRLVYHSGEVPGLMPSLIPSDLDSNGIELIATGGKPIYLDLLNDIVKRILVVGEPGSGKTAVAWRFIIEAIAKRTPTVAIDFSFGKNNSFEYVSQILGEDAAYIDLSKTASNLLQPPDLTKYPLNERASRMIPWIVRTKATLNAIVTWGETNSTLTQRAVALIGKSLAIFLDNDDIIRRYNDAFDKGYKSKSWRQMPVIKDWLKFVNVPDLNLKNPSQTDKNAINLIHTQVSAFLTTPVGKLISRPSSIPPEPLVKFFNFSEIGNKKEEYVVANVAISACLRNILSNSRSLLIGDEIEALLKKEGFGEAVASLCSMGRKNGANVVLMTHGIKCFYSNGIGEEILDTITHKMIGKVTADCANFLINKWSIDPKYISQNVTEQYSGKNANYTNWLILNGGKAWQTKCYLSSMVIGAIANDISEAIYREAIRAKYPRTFKGEMLALKEFSNNREQGTGNREQGRDRILVK